VAEIKISRESLRTQREKRKMQLRRRRTALGKKQQQKSPLINVAPLKASRAKTQNTKGKTPQPDSRGQEVKTQRSRGRKKRNREQRNREQRVREGRNREVRNRERSSKQQIGRSVSSRRYEVLPVKALRIVREVDLLRSIATLRLARVVSIQMRRRGQV
jgi:hypothetical protein